MAKKKAKAAAKPARTIKTEKDEKDLASLVVRFLALLPDDFSLVAEDDDTACELAQISTGIDCWAFDVLGQEGLDKAAETSRLETEEAPK